MMDVAREEPLMIRCPICDKPFDPETSPAMPFCSDRCRQIDLGRWLREVYSVPVERDPEEDSVEDPGQER
jgi:endogenous inhibitor of DNA gyrase (YacG/DUF329 family)